MPRELSQRLWVARTYLGRRKVRWLAGAALLSGVLVAVVGSREVAVPSFAGDGSSVQLWRLFAVTAGILPVLTLTSSLDDLEAAAGAPFHRYRTWVLVASFLVASAALLLGAVPGRDLTVAEQTARALLAWFGLSLLSGRVLGWSRCWILPWGALSAILYWGYDSAARTYRWWEFSAQPVSHVPSLALSLALLLLGLAAYALTPWRMRALRATAAITADRLPAAPPGHGVCVPRPARRRPPRRGR